MKNKKAILMPKVLIMLISVVCIVLLIILAVKLYGIFIQKTEIEQARAMHNQLVEFIDSLEENTEGAHDIQTRKAETWLVYFGDDPNNKLLCICLESNIRERCVKDALGVCEKTGYVFEMLTPDEDVNIQYIKLNTLLVNLRVKKLDGVINIMKSIVASSGESWEEFSALRPGEICPESEEFNDFNSIKEVIINLPNYWNEIKNENPHLFDERIFYLKNCLKQFQMDSERFGIFMILPEDMEVAFNPRDEDAGFDEDLDEEFEDYWETKLTTEDGKKIIIKIYPAELF